MKRIVSALLFSISMTALVAGNAAAQVNFDPVKHAYFVTGNATINTDLGNNDLFVGKDNATNFATLPGTITLTAGDNLRVGGFGSTYPDGNSYLGLNVFGTHRVNFTGGGAEFTSWDSSTVNVSGGQFPAVRTFDNSVLNVNGGTVDSVQLGRIFNNPGVPTLNIRGGRVNFVGPFGSGVVNLSGGSVYSVINQESGKVNIHGGDLFFTLVAGDVDVNMSGGSATHVESHTGSNINLAGGIVGGSNGGFGGAEFDTTPGIYHMGQTLNLYGNGFALNNSFAGQFGSTNGTFSTLTGTLLDGSVLNTLLFLGTGSTLVDRGGTSQGDAVLPDGAGNGIFSFNSVPSGAWFDPPIVDSFHFLMTDGNLFTGILELPAGFDSAFSVRVGNLLLGSFGAGQSVNFADFGFAGGVSAFTIENITPGVDAENPLAFPIRLGFSAPFASFSMLAGAASAAAPEPGTVGLVLLGGVCATMGRRRVTRG